MRWILSRPSCADRHLGAGRDIAAEAHELGEPVISPGRCLAVAGLFGRGLEHGEMLRLQHLAAEFERVLPGGMGQFVDEAFDCRSCCGWC